MSAEGDLADAARLLREAEREALLWLPADGSERRFAVARIARALRRLRSRGLCAQRIVVPGYETVWRATAEGLALRAAMLAMAGLGEAALGHRRSPAPAPSAGASRLS